MTAAELHVRPMAGAITALTFRNENQSVIGKKHAHRAVSLR